MSLTQKLGMNVREAVQSLASLAGVFRGALFLHSLWGAKKYELS